MDKAGLIYARGEFNEIYTFPQDAAKLKAAWKEAIPQGSYDLVLTLNLGKGLEEKNFGRGPVLTKETELSIGADGEVLSVGELE
jgi:hypothetical protein